MMQVMHMFFERKNRGSNDLSVAKQRRGLYIIKTKMQGFWDLWPNARVGGSRGSHFGRVGESDNIGGSQCGMLWSLARLGAMVWLRRLRGVNA